MGTIIYRGSTPTIKFKPLNNVSVSELGTPSIAIAQELVYLTPEVIIDAADNSISAKLTEEDTLSLVEGVETSAQQIWEKVESGNTTIIRYPVHQLTVATTVMEEVSVEPTPEPTGELINLHPFFVYSPFIENGYFSPYMDDGGTLVEQWEEATTPWSSYLDSYMFRFNASDAAIFENFIVTPLTVSTLLEGQSYYLWVNSPGPDAITIDITAGSGYSFDTVNGSDTYSVELTTSDALITLVAANSAFNQPMFQVRVRTPNPTGANKIGMALYAIQEDLPQSDYKRYIPYDGGDV